MSHRQTIEQMTGRTLWICNRHSERLRWALSVTEKLFPIRAEHFKNLKESEIAYLDQLASRFSKLQDAMGAKLFPQILELLKEKTVQLTFIDKLNRLEKIGVIDSSEQWLMLREMRNAFSHDYPEDSELNAATLNKAVTTSEQLLDAFEQAKRFAIQYGAVEL